jgi:SAM-dependent methyltransferase
MTTWPYDLTAEFYDQDMGLSAPLRSVDWYLAEAARATGDTVGPVLDLGCGTGRIALPMAAAGMHVLAVDRSQPMLGAMMRKSTALPTSGAVWPVAMDMARLGLKGRFAVVTCAYSSFAYLVDDDARAGMLAGVTAALAEGGRLLMDMYIPDPELEARARAAELPDYVRRLPDGPWAPAVTLARSRRLLVGDRPCIRRWLRRYRFLDTTGRLVRELQTESVQRAYQVDELVSVLEAAGFEICDDCGDFEAGVAATVPARTVAIVARCSTR